MAAERNSAKRNKPKQSDRYAKRAYKSINHAHIPDQKPTYSWLIVGAIGKY